MAGTRADHTNLDEQERIADKLRDEVGEERWQELLRFNTYQAGAFDLRLRLFWTPDGKPACAFESVRK